MLARSQPWRRVQSLQQLGTLFGDFARFTGKRRGSRAAILLLLGSLMEGIGLLLLVPLLGIVLGASTGSERIDAFTRQLNDLTPGASPTMRLALLLGIFSVLLAVRAWIIMARDLNLAKLHIGFVEHRRLRIIELLAGTRWDALSRLQHGRITHVLGGDIQACGDAVQLLLLCGVAAAMLVSQIALAFLLSPILTIAVLALLTAAALLLWPLLRQSRRMGAALTDSNLQLVTRTSHFLGGLKLAMSQDLQRSFVREFEATIGHARDRKIEFVRQRTGSQLALTALAALVAGCAILAGLSQLGLAPPTLIAFLFVLARINGPAAQIQTAGQHVFHSLPAYSKIKELEAELARAQTDPEPGPATSCSRLTGRIEFKGVLFEHGRNGGVRNLDLAIEAGEFVGVTGPSGAGKTTFADLLVGLYPPQGGSISVAGRPLAGEVLASWRRSLGYVAQDPFLFHDSIRRNLLWARPDAEESELWAAIEAAGAGDLVRRVGLDVVVGERGTLISGGERQRIALARALLRRPALLLLDEATNAIDAEGERRIFEELTASSHRPTMIMIAHRDTSLALCDRILVFEQGRLMRDERL